MQSTDVLIVGGGGCGLARAVVRDGSPVPERDPMGQRYRPTTRAGHRLPHCWLDRAGRRLSTHDLVGRSERFVLFVDKLEQWRKAADAVRRLCKIDVDVVVVDNHDAFDTEGCWQQLREVDSGGAILARPDNIVAWRSRNAITDQTEQLLSVFEAILGARR
jgi:2,4-dichlorophenol 6-monooxygenase